MTEDLYSRNSQPSVHPSSEFTCSTHGRIRRSDRAQSRGRGYRRARPAGHGLKSGTVLDIWVVLLLPRRGTLVVGDVRQGALFFVIEACPIFQIHGDGGSVVE